MSPAKDLGNKHTCWKCETKFYDLRKAVPLCPKCGADQRESPALKTPVREARKAPPKAAKAIREPIADETPEEEEVLPEEEEGEEEAPEEEEEEEV